MTKLHLVKPQGQAGNGIPIILNVGIICEWAYSQRGGGRRRSHCHPPKARCRGSMRSCTASTRCPLPEREMRNTGNTSTCKRVETGTLSPPCHMKTSQQHNDDVTCTHSSKRPASMLTIWESRTTTASPSMFPIQASLQTIFCWSKQYGKRPIVDVTGKIDDENDKVGRHGIYHFEPRKPSF